MRTNHIIPYVLAGVLHVVATLMPLPRLALITKPLLIPLLATALFLACRPVRSAFLKGVFLALFFSWLGDILLMKAGDTTFFLLGLGAFFLAQLSYIRAFWLFPEKGFGILRRAPWLALPFLLILGGMLAALWNGLGDALRIPVVLYSATLVSMGIMAAGMSGKTKPRSALFLVAGALLFILSDSLIALDRFSELEIWEPRFSIMATYISAQGLIGYGVSISGHREG